MVKGSYAMIIQLKEDIAVNIRRKSVELKKGYYLYVGSALNGIVARLRRHFKRGKKIHWHVDNLTEKGEVLEAYYVVREDRLECEIARRIRLERISGFGDSDCRCGGHLFYSADKNQMVVEIKSVMSVFGEVKKFEREY